MTDAWDDEPGKQPRVDTSTANVPTLLMKADKPKTGVTVLRRGEVPTAQQPAQPARKAIKTLSARPAGSKSNNGAGSNGASSAASPSAAAEAKRTEQREQEYEAARAKIFAEVSAAAAAESAADDREWSSSRSASMANKGRGTAKVLEGIVLPSGGGGSGGKAANGKSSKSKPAAGSTRAKS